MRPDAEYNNKLASSEKARLLEMTTKLTQEERIEIQKDAKDLAVLQDEKEGENHIYYLVCINCRFELLTKFKIE